MRVSLLVLWLAAVSPSIDATPRFGAVRADWRSSDAVLLDRHGGLLHRLRLDQRVRRLDWVPLGAMSPALINAVVAAEDRRFFEHRGVDWKALGAAAWNRLRGGPPRGASTLSMQVAALLDPELSPIGARRSSIQKLRQILAALELEGQWSKPQILEAYLNLASFRGELQGIGAAAQGLFGKAASGLDFNEALLLAALLRSPGADAGKLADRSCTLAATRHLPGDCASIRVRAGELPPAAGLSAASGIAPHLAHELLSEPGQSVTTTLDATIQRIALGALEEQLRLLAGRNVRDGAALVADNSTGEILAYVASGGPYSRAPRVDGIRARRQAGSTLKPFLYGLALERRYLTAASLLNDAPVNLETSGGMYIPQNYDHDFKGIISVRTALAGSLNIPAVRALSLVGVDRFRERLFDLGYRGIVREGDYYGFSLALGSADVSLWEQVNAFRSLANGGRLTALTLMPPQATPHAVDAFDPRAAFIVADILADRAGRAVTFGLDNPLTTRFWSAVKTGTSKDMRDNWCIGFSQRYTVGVWVGNFEGDSMHEVSGITGAAPVWLEIMNELNGSDAAAGIPPPPPSGLTQREVRFNPAVEPPRKEWFIAGTESATIAMIDPTRRRARITSPPRGVVVALDPDMPATHQAMMFIARPATADLSFRLDDETLGSASRPVPWQPVPGRHRLSLLRADGHSIDSVDFTVRDPR
ncbi:MAG: penicillin-binding protein 1C [Methylotetracoccus sp.]